MAPLKPPRGRPEVKNDQKSKKLKNHNLINNQGPFFDTEPWGRVSLEDKLLIVALGGPHKSLAALKGHPEAPQRSKMAENDHKSKIIVYNKP